MINSVMTSNQRVSALMQAAEKGLRVIVSESGGMYSVTVVDEDGKESVYYDLTDNAGKTIPGTCFDEMAREVLWEKQ